MLRNLGITVMFVIATVGAASAAQPKPLSTPKQEIAKQSGSTSAQKSATSDKDKDTADKVTVVVSNQETAASSPDSNKSKNDEDVRIQRKLANFTAGLVIVGLFQAVALFLTVIWIKQQAKFLEEHAGYFKDLAEAAADNAKAAALSAQTIERQTGIMDDQLKAMKSQLVTTGSQLVEMGRQTEMLERSVQIVISKERPRLSVKVNALNLTNPGLQSVKYDVQFSGLTTAFILGSTAILGMSDSEEPPTFLFKPSMHKISAQITPSTAPFEGKAFLMPDLTLTEGQITDIIERKRFIHFWGFIKYRDVFYDVFKRDRETIFGWVWNFTDHPDSTDTSKPWGYWKERYYSET
jgi:hypothetical protein